MYFFFICNCIYFYFIFLRLKTDSLRVVWALLALAGEAQCPEGSHFMGDEQRTQRSKSWRRNTPGSLQNHSRHNETETSTSLFQHSRPASALKYSAAIWTVWSQNITINHMKLYTSYIHYTDMNNTHTQSYFKQDVICNIYCKYIHFAIWQFCKKLKNSNF